MNRITSHKYAVIMAGGSGTRFWPASRIDRPKQFLDILGAGRTLIQMTYDRLIDIMPPENIYVVADQRYKEICLDQLADIPEDNYIAEPGKKNTAPCALLSAMIIHKRDPEALILTCPSDHVILKPTELNQAIDTAFHSAQTSQSLLTLGLKPTYPATGYGYILTDRIELNQVSQVERFVEKPDLSKAKQYLEDGQYLWNSGMFIWSSQAILNTFETCAPDIRSCFPSEVNDLSEKTIHEAYDKVESISVDYAILERASDIKVVAVDPGWSDLGTWNSLHSHINDSKDNVSINTDPLCIENENTLIYSETNRKIIAVGLKDYNVIDMNDTLVIIPKSYDQNIKEILKTVHQTHPDLT